MEVGIRDLRDNLSRYVDLVRGGDVLVVTDRGKAVAQVVPIERGRTLERLILDGTVTPATRQQRSLPEPRVQPSAPVSDLIDDQRR